MQLFISKEAQAKIKEKMQADDYLILDYEDAIGPFVDSQASCQLYPSFRILLVPASFPKEQLTVYDHQHETPIGKVYMKSRSEMLLDHEVHLIVEPIYHSFQLKADSGILANNLELKRINPKDYEDNTPNATIGC